MKIRNKIVQIIALVVVVCYGYSCSDDFYTENAGNRITPDKFYNTQEELDNGINGTYVPLQKAYANLLLIDGLRSDLLDVTSNSDQYMKDINDQVLSTDNPYLDGSDYYKSIMDCNEIIKNMDQVWIKDPSTDIQRPHLSKGVLYNIKALCYLNLVRLYGKAALINDNMSSFTSTQVILNKRDMIDTMINQLKPYVFTDTKLEEIRFGYGPNTKLLIGEMYLENGQYDSAIFYLKLGCESYKNDASIFKVKDFPKERWKEIFYTDNRGTENADLIQFAEKKDQYNAFTGWTVTYKVKPTQIIYNMYTSQTPFRGSNGDIYRGVGVTLDTLPGTTDQFYVSKYALVSTEPYSAYIITQRGADMHLLLAEAFNMIGDTSKALGFVNAGLKNVKPSPKGYAKWTGGNGIRGRVALKNRTVTPGLSGVDLRNAVEDIIMDERMLELAYEGKRWFDLVRVAERRGDPSYLANKVAAKFSDPTKSAQIYNTLMDPAKWYLPTK